MDMTHGGMDTPTGSTEMGHGGSGLMGMDTMAMTFFTSTTTPLYSLSWYPDSAGKYAGTCIFLIAFATIFRALLAVRLNFVEVLAIIKFGRKEGVIYPDDHQRIRPWRADEAVTLAAMDVVLAGTSYLLMIAVMTMNVGYFISVLAGVFLGSVIFTRFMAYSAAH